MPTSQENLRKLADKMDSEAVQECLSILLQIYSDHLEIAQAYMAGNLYRYIRESRPKREAVRECYGLLGLTRKQVSELLNPNN